MHFCILFTNLLLCPMADWKFSFWLVKGTSSCTENIDWTWRVLWRCRGEGIGKGWEVGLLAGVLLSLSLARAVVCPDFMGLQVFGQCLQATSVRHLSTPYMAITSTFSRNQRHALQHCCNNSLIWCQTLCTLKQYFTEYVYICFVCTSFNSSHPFPIMKKSLFKHPL
jgi:hypothetical protein